MNQPVFWPCSIFKILKKLWEFLKFWNLGTWWVLKFWGLGDFATTPKHVHEGEIPPACEHCELQHVTKDTYHCIHWFDTKILQFTDRKLNQTLVNFSKLTIFFFFFFGGGGGGGVYRPPPAPTKGKPQRGNQISQLWTLITGLWQIPGKNGEEKE